MWLIGEAEVNKTFKDGSSPSVATKEEKFSKVEI